MTINTFRLAVPTCFVIQPYFVIQHGANRTAYVMAEGHRTAGPLATILRRGPNVTCTGDLGISLTESHSRDDFYRQQWQFQP
ncbi:hypothetical protein ACFYT3_33865 [Nocardia amikacinitolerans]|uniref:hypothetical protein n=1 Tax=Nocardia amikacinitolerans TaxID=756689 RepID=UPI0020A37D3F|nr:hypothetical protein [Nocardia amikacinitolerans]